MTAPSPAAPTRTETEAFARVAGMPGPVGALVGAAVLAALTDPTPRQETKR